MQAPITIINTVAGYLDLSQLYGSAVAAALVNADGTLKTSDNGLALPVVNDMFVAGDPRVMENPELTALTILFYARAQLLGSGAKGSSCELDRLPAL